MFNKEVYTISHGTRAVELSVSYAPHLPPDQTRLELTFFKANELLINTMLTKDEFEKQFKEATINIWYGYPSVVMFGYSFNYQYVEPIPEEDDEDDLDALDEPLNEPLMEVPEEEPAPTEIEDET